ncbi:hypothetical protein GCM10027578_22380 [Spirosoma luteolum]
MTPIRWLLIALALVGGAGVAYWLLRTPKAASPAPGQPALGLGLTGGGGSILLPPTSNLVDGTDQGRGNYASNPDWVVGDYGAPSGTDSEGRPFERSTAPTIPFEAKNQPYATGIAYSFPEQTAKGAALLKRFPPFQLTDARLHLMGPWYADADANAHFSRGVTTLAVLPNFRLPGSPQDASALPRTKKSVMYGDDTVRTYAYIFANEIGSDDQRYPYLYDFTQGVLSAGSEAEWAFESLGTRIWYGERSTVDQQGQGSAYVTFDLETTWPYDSSLSMLYLRNCLGWLYLGFCSGAANEGHLIRPFNYGSYQMQIELDASSFAGPDGLPNYLQPEFDFLGGYSPLMDAMNRFGGVMAIDSYIQAIWGREPMLLRDGNGQPIPDGDGNVIFQDVASTVAYGQSLPLESGEAYRCIIDIYEQSIRLYLQLHRLADGYPSESGQRRAGLENVSAGAFTRFSNEGVNGIVQNDRPVPAWELELFNALNLFLAPELYAWGVDFNRDPVALGAYNAAWPTYQADGVAEQIIKAAHVHSAFGNIQNSRFKWCWFNLPIVSYFKIDGHKHGQKAICHGKLRDVNGTVWIELFLAFPLTDDRPTTFTVWIEQGGVQSQPYLCQLPNGRSYFYDAWQLPATFAYDALTGANVWISYPDVFDVPRTHRGDYRLAV